MVEISIVISSIIDAGIRAVKALVWGAEDRKTHLEAMPFGVDAVPVKDIRAIVVQSTTKQERVVLGYINTDQQASEGEYRVYSIDGSGATATYVWLKADGTIELGGNADTAVKFSPLKTAFDELRDDLNDLKEKVNSNSQDISSFASSYVAGGPSTQGLPPSFSYGNEQGSDSTADINPSEEPDVKLGN